jgi:hypothetical protein
MARGDDKRRLSEHQLKMLVSYLYELIQKNGKVSYYTLNKKEAKKAMSMETDRHVDVGDWKGALAELLCFEDVRKGPGKGDSYVFVRRPSPGPIKDVHNLDAAQRSLLAQNIKQVVKGACLKESPLSVQEARNRAERRVAIHVIHLEEWRYIMQEATQGDDAVYDTGGFLVLAHAGKIVGFPQPTVKDVQKEGQPQEHAETKPEEPVQPVPAGQVEQQVTIEGLVIEVTAVIAKLGDKPLILKAEQGCSLHVILEGLGGLISFEATRIEVSR